MVRRGYSVRAASRNPGAPDYPPGVERARLPDLSGPVDWRPLLAGVTEVVHLASASHARPEIAELVYDRVTRGAADSLAPAALRAGIRRLVFMSSIRAQTGRSTDRIVTEAIEARPTDA